MKPGNFLFCVFLPIGLYAQQSEIRGVVSIHNSKFETGKTEYVANVQIEESFGRGNATISDVGGHFKFSTVGIPFKETMTIVAKKQGLELVNPEELNVVVGQVSWVKIYMCPKGKITENKRKYYNIGKTESEKALSAKITEKQTERERLLKDAKANQQAIWALESEIKNLYDKYQTIDANARELAEKFSRVNLDDASEHYQRAFRHFQNGKIDSALIVLEEADYARQVDEILLEEIKLASLKDVVHHNDSVLSARKDSLIKTYFLKIQALEDSQQYQEGVQSCRNLLDLHLTDTITTIKVLQKLSWLSLLNHSFTDAEQFALLGLSLSKNDPMLNRYWAIVTIFKDAYDEKAITKIFTAYPIEKSELLKLEESNLPSAQINKLTPFVQKR